MEQLTDLARAVEAGDRESAVAITTKLVDDGMAPMDVVDGGLIPGMSAIGERFKDGEAYVPEMLIAARAMKECMAVLEPLLLAAGVRPDHTAVVGTVEGDLHDIGKNLVATMWKGAGIGVVDVGTNASAEQFVAAVRESNADLVGLSALLTTTMPAMKGVVAALRKEGFDSLKILVGGAPVTPEYAEEIGADGYAPDAANAVDAAMLVLGA